MIILHRRLASSTAENLSRQRDRDAETVECIYIYPPPPTKVTLSQIVFFSREDEPLGHNQRDTADSRPRIRWHRGRTHVQRRPLTSSVFSEVVSLQFGAREIRYKDAGRSATAGVCRTDAEHVNNLLKSFYSSSPSEDRFRTAPLGPDEWTCLTEYVFFFPHGESLARGGALSHCFISFHFWELKCKMGSMWWLLGFILALCE